MYPLLLLPLVRVGQRGRRCLKAPRRLRVFFLFLALDVVVCIKHYSVRTYLGLLLEVLWLGYPAPAPALALVLARSTHVFRVATLPSVISSLLMLHHSLAPVRI